MSVLRDAQALRRGLDTPSIVFGLLLRLARLAGSAASVHFPFCHASIMQRYTSRFMTRSLFSEPAQVHQIFWESAQALRRLSSATGPLHSDLRARNEAIHWSEAEAFGLRLKQGRNFSFSGEPNFLQHCWKLTVRNMCSNTAGTVSALGGVQ